MVETIKEAVSDSALELTKGMASANPFVAFLLIVLVVMLGWFLWQSHTLQSVIIDLKLTDQQQHFERADLVRKFTEQLIEIDEIADISQSSVTALSKELALINNRDSSQFKEYKADFEQLESVLNANTLEIQNKLDDIIQNQYEPCKE